MNKEFIPYEQALELKELGFDEKCLGYYHTELSSSDVDLVIGKTQDRFYRLIRIPEHFDTLAPLYQQAFRWFRDKKLADGSICRHGNADGSYSYRWDIVYEYGVYEQREFKQDYKTYEEAELACLKRLIELVKNK